MRREGDSNSRSEKNQTAVFETAALDHYAIPPYQVLSRRFELPTSTSATLRSIQLSYESK